jgi:hypothetical protein
MGYGDTFIADGGASRHFGSLWWASGRYIEVLVETADEPLTVQSIALVETRYPYEFPIAFEASDTRLSGVTGLALRTLQMCSHESSMDCPYFEQLNYTGDTRLQSLVAMHASPDDRLVRKSIRLFDWSRTGDNWTSSRYPTRTLQTIPPFALWWVAMVYDYARYRGDKAFISKAMPGVRGILERWREQIRDDGLVVLPAGWNFIDWLDSWEHGTRNPIGSTCGIEQWHLVYTLEIAAQLEEMLGENHLAHRNRETAMALATAAESAFLDTKRGILADDLEHTKFSEHAQVLALLSGHLSAGLRDAAGAALTNRSDVAPTSIYFSHYTFEALREIGRIDKLIDRMGLWFEHSSKGMYTLVEQPEPTRSDCHAWAAHPVYHYFATILGIRPAAFGFEKVEIRPQLGPLVWAKGDMVHPRGIIRVKAEMRLGKLSGEVELPDGLTASVIANEKTMTVNGGKHTFG